MLLTIPRTLAASEILLKYEAFSIQRLESLNESIVMQLVVHSYYHIVNSSSCSMSITNSFLLVLY